MAVLNLSSKRGFSMTCLLCEVVVGCGKRLVALNTKLPNDNLSTKIFKIFYFNIYPCYNTAKNEKVGRFSFNEEWQLSRSIYKLNRHNDLK